MSEEIINKVAQSGLVTINLEDYYEPGERFLIDIKDQLFHGQILREKDFRDFVKSENWEKYQNKMVAITCSADAIVPIWAYMLMAIQLEPYAKRIFFGDLEVLESNLFSEKLKQINLDLFRDARVVIKGCGNLPVPKSAYVELTRLLRPVVKSIMYGEPCSTVPLFKKK